MNRISDLDSNVDLLKFIFINSPTGVLILDTDGRIIISNKSAEHILRKNDVDGLIVKDLYEGRDYFLIGEEFINKLSFNELPFERSLQGHKYMGFEYAIADEDAIYYIRMSAQAITDTEGTIRGALVLLDDISERVKRDKEIQATERRYKRIIQASSDYILIVNREGIIEFINRVRSEGKAEDVFGMSVYDFVDEESRAVIFENVNKAFETGESQTYITKALLEDGLCFFRSTITLFKSSNSEDTKAIITSSEITDIIQAEQEIKVKNEQLRVLNEELRQYNYMATHDLKLPIANIQGYLELLKDEVKNPGEIEKDCFFWLFESLNQANRKIADLIELSKAKDTSFHRYEAIDFKEFLDDAVKRFKESIKWSSKYELSTQFCEQDIYFDKSGLVSIIDNLFSNAFKYRDQERPLRIEVACKSEEDMFVLNFSDNGLGIDKQKVGDRIFNLFERFNTDSEGSGLGLYLVKSIVERSGGTVSYTSTLGEGTTFILKIPDQRK
ncbi:MAG: PAS domain-containing sensor histidine kinase [Flavobacteriales bacterium]|nr:PAS domain-containing sensor histidine kinase [Flavobacteriales bacterium]